MASLIAPECCVIWFRGDGCEDVDEEEREYRMLILMGWGKRADLTSSGMRTSMHVEIKRCKSTKGRGGNSCICSLEPGCSLEGCWF